MVSLKKALRLSERGVVSLVGAGGKTSLMFKLAGELSDSGASVLTTTTTRIFRPTKDQSKHVILSASPDDVVKKAEHLLKNTRHVTAAKRKLETQGKLEGFSPQEIDELWSSDIFQWIIVEADGAKKKPLKAPGIYEPVIPNCSHIVIGVVGLHAIGKPLEKKWVFRPEIFTEITKLDLGKPIDEASVAKSILHDRGIMKGSPAAAKQIVFLNQADVTGGLGIGRKIRDILISQEQNQLKGIIIGHLLYEPSVKEYLELT